MEDTQTMTAEASNLTLKDFYSKLSERVSTYNAKLLLQSAVLQSGVDSSDSTSLLNKEEAKTICLELIKKGGPAFQVGKQMYQLVQ